MKVKYIWVVLLLGILLPAVVLSNIQGLDLEAKKSAQADNATTQQTEATEQGPMAIDVIKDGTPIQMELEEYLVGVVLCEMPPEFDVEALKAQAVVARTYTLRRCLMENKHSEGAVCTSPACCQGYTDPEGYRDAYGLEKVTGAVWETAGQVLTFQGELIEATYFSCSGGMTEDARAVWGEEVPYLRAKESPGEEQATHYSDTVQFSTGEFTDLLGIDPSGPAETWVADIIYTPGGGVDTLRIGDEVFTGVTLRKLLGLRSTAMHITAVGNTVTVTTRGFGHRVGMSQYGAEAMAVSGRGYEEILRYYYEGTELTVYPASCN